MENLTLGQYRKMVEEVIDFKRLNGNLPEYTTVDGCRISKQDYIDMIERVNRFFLEMGRNPKSVEIERTEFTKTEKILAH